MSIYTVEYGDVKHYTVVVNDRIYNIFTIYNKLFPVGMC